MAQYAVKWDYRAGRRILTAGTTVDLNDDQARHINNDSPGVLAPVGAAADLAPSEADLESGEGTRQVKAARNRAITKAPHDRSLTATDEDEG